MTLQEAARLLVGLSADTTTRTFVALSGWAYPMSHDAIVMADLFDAFTAANFKNPKPYPRPWSKKLTTERRGVSTTLTQDEVIAALEMAGHKMPIPTR